MLDDALRYALELGWYVFPCHTPRTWPGETCSCERGRRHKDPNYKCDNQGKHPRIAHGLDAATIDPEQIREWWQQWPDANIGVNCGRSGILMVDLDTYKDSYKGHDLELNEDTVTAISGSPGTHLYYRMEPGDTFGNSNKNLPAGIDIRGHGGYVIVAPSLHASGRRYQWEANSDPWEIEMASIPPKLRTILESNRILKTEDVSYDTSRKYNGTGASAYGQKALDAECEKIRAAGPGHRHDPIRDAAFAIGRLVAGGELDHDYALSELTKAAVDCGAGADHIDRTLPESLDAGMEHPKSSKESAEADVAATWAVKDCPDLALLRGAGYFNLLDYSAEDGGILDLWFDLYGKERMFTVGYDSWFVWSGTHWRKDEDLFVEGEIERLMDTMNAKAKIGLEQSAGDKESMRLYAGYVAATKRSKNRVASVEGMARSRCAARSAALNHGNTLNLSNGVLDLDTFELRPHSPDERLTYCLTYAYDPAADCARFKRFLSEVLVKDNTTETDEELVQLYREAMGYALTTDTSHEAMFWLSGDGGNGKTVAITILQKLLGPLCFSVSFEEMGRASNYDLAEVAGKRVVFSTESERGGKLAEGHIKRIVSGERINARPIYGSPFEFHSTAKVFWGMNDLPVVRDTSNGVWRRLKLIPFLRTFTEKDRDPGLISKLEKELPGILNLALQGLKDLRERGRFPESAAVASAVEEYRHENNPVQQWLDERTQPTYIPGYIPDAYPTSAKSLFEDYKTWAENNGRQSMNSTNFGREMRRLRIPKKDARGGIMYAISLL